MDQIFRLVVSGLQEAKHTVTINKLEEGRQSQLPENLPCHIRYIRSMRDFLPQLSATDYVLDKRVVMVESGDLHYILKRSTFDAFVCKGCIILVLL
jgi:hypothetical protein